MDTAAMRRVNIRVTGVVQGVGFRPFVYRIANSLHLTGHVGNDSSGVFIEVEGPSANINTLLERLPAEAPPLAHITAIRVTEIVPQLDSLFSIVHSASMPTAHTLVSPDLCTCENCRRELLDPSDRRYRYPFINCTDCGPRFTIIKKNPYDRPYTTMAPFQMCPACQQEYDNPADRRFHAQPNGCANCGPQVIWEHPSEPSQIGEDAIQQTRVALAGGQIIAIKGLGGFHLACDATDNLAVETLRQRKKRPGKPFAVMTRDVTSARRFAYLSERDITLLTSRERPIVLTQLKQSGVLAAAVAPGLNTVGVMLPYTPLHELIIDDRPLVMTSANLSGEPIIKDNDQAQAKLAAIVDGFLLHNRDIHVACDDSVVRADYPVRRSRGYAPFPVSLPIEVSPLLATGGELKSTCCLSKGQQAFMSQHIGDMQNLETLHAFQQTTTHLQELFQLEPQAIICDQHPAYLSTRWAERHAREHGIPLIRVQHHHAHLAAVMAENLLPPASQVIGFCLDGTGYGPDDTIWGGEVFVGGYAQAERVTHLRPMPLAGGDAAIHRPYRLALAYLWACGLPWGPELPPVQACPDEEQKILARQLERSLNVVQTSSMGRLFDAVASLLGICQETTYEGQAAILLETACKGEGNDAYPFNWDPAPLLTALLADSAAGVPVGAMARKFHTAIAQAILHTSRELRQQHQLNTVALSGGVFQNIRLLRQTTDLLRADAFDVITHQLVPPNDGGLALGQIMVGHFKMHTT